MAASSGRGPRRGGERTCHRWAAGGGSGRCGGAPLPAVGCLLAVTEPGRESRSMTDLIVEKSMPGVSIGTIWDKCGMRASQTAEVVFDDVPVPKANVLGEPGRGMRAALRIIDYDRLMGIPLAV